MFSSFALSWLFMPSTCAFLALIARAPFWHLSRAPIAARAYSNADINLCLFPSLAFFWLFHIPFLALMPCTFLSDFLERFSWAIFLSDFLGAFLLLPSLRISLAPPFCAFLLHPLFVEVLFCWSVLSNFAMLKRKLLSCVCYPVWLPSTHGVTSALEHACNTLGLLLRPAHHLQSLPCMWRWCWSPPPTTPSYLSFWPQTLGRLRLAPLVVCVLDDVS